MVLKQYEYNDACLDITPTSTPDPWICQANGKFYLTFTGSNRIPMWEAASIKDFLGEKAKHGPVWRTSWAGPQSDLLWGPELHCLRGRWFIYFSGANGNVGNRSHRMYVLSGPLAHEDPHKGPWVLVGSIAGMDQRQWAIDGTIFEIDGTLYFVYSGWPKREDGKWEDKAEMLQQLYILRMKDPVTADSEPVMISNPDKPWEKVQGTNIAINEGPQWLESPSGHWKGLVYSCSASWTKDYKMATLQYLPDSGKGPLDPSSWRKSSEPLIQNRPDGKGPFGPGHGSFLHLSDETLALFHATDRPTDGNKNRRCRMQRVRWTDDGPDMGGYVGESTKDPEVFYNAKKHGGAGSSASQTDSLNPISMQDNEC